MPARLPGASAPLVAEVAVQACALELAVPSAREGCALEDSAREVECALDLDAMSLRYGVHQGKLPMISPFTFTCTNSVHTDTRPLS